MSNDRDQPTGGSDEHLVGEHRHYHVPTYFQAPIFIFRGDTADYRFACTRTVTHGCNNRLGQKVVLTSFAKRKNVHAGANQERGFTCLLFFCLI